MITWKEYHTTFSNYCSSPSRWHQKDAKQLSFDNPSIRQPGWIE